MLTAFPRTVARVVRSAIDPPAISERVVMFFALLMNLPADVVQFVAMAPGFDLRDSKTCLCGWAIRADILATAGIDNADEVYSAHPVPEKMSKRFGGKTDEWYELFYGVMGSSSPDIEAAWLARVAVAVELGV